MSGADIRILYFAWLRERIGTGQESVSLPPEVDTVEALVGWLRERDERHQAGFANAALIRCAVNQEFATPRTRIAPGDEVAFFPPVTGG
jgi:molybdopterin converting factor subunit 1